MGPRTPSSAASTGSTLVGSDYGPLKRIAEDVNARFLTPVLDQGSEALTNRQQAPGKFRLDVDNDSVRSRPGQFNKAAIKDWIDLANIAPDALESLVPDAATQDSRGAYSDHGRPIPARTKLKAWIKQTKRGLVIRLKRPVNDRCDEVTDVHFEKKHPLSRDPAYLYNYLSEMYPNNQLQKDGAQGFDKADPHELEAPHKLVQELHGSDVSELPESLFNQSSFVDKSQKPIVLHDQSQRRLYHDQNEDESKTGVAHDPIDSAPDAPSINAAMEPADDNDGSSTNSSIAPTPTRFRSLAAGSHATERLAASESDHQEKSNQVFKATHKTPSPAALRDSGLSVVGSLRYTSTSRTRGGIGESDMLMSPFSGTDDEEHRPLQRSANQYDLDGRFLNNTKLIHSSGTAEARWTELLELQTKILGPDHVLTIRAREERDLIATSALPLQRRISALKKSNEVAVENLGLIHPQVRQFSALLEDLEHTLGGNGNGHAHALPFYHAQSQRLQLSPISTTSDGESSRTPLHPSVQRDIPTLAFHINTESPTESSAGAQTLSGKLEPDSKQGDNEAGISTESSGHREDIPTTTQPQNVKRLTPLDTQNLVQEQSMPSSSMSTSRSANIQTPATFDAWFNTHRSPHPPRHPLRVMTELLVAGTISQASKGAQWLQRNYGPEPSVIPGQVRVRWTCHCGEQMHDDFVEQRPGAARELEAYLNRPRMQPEATSPTSSGAGSTPGTVFTPGASNVSSATTWSMGSMNYNAIPGPTSPTTDGGRMSTSTDTFTISIPNLKPPWLLTCANEGAFTPKLAHLDMGPYKIRSDRDLAVTLREHYFNLNRHWYRVLRIRGLVTIDFVQFEVHKNRSTDTRKCPDIPPQTVKDYDFQPRDLIPPVGSKYLLHLFKHPEDYDDELITYLRLPKRNDKLQGGVGWGIHLVEGFMPDRVWMLTVGFFVTGSLVFAIAWAWKKHDVQGAFGVAAWVCTLAALLMGWCQACLG